MQNGIILMDSDFEISHNCWTVLYVKPKVMFLSLLPSRRAVAVIQLVNPLVEHVDTDVDVDFVDEERWAK